MYFQKKSKNSIKLHEKIKLKNSYKEITNHYQINSIGKVEKVLKSSLDSISSPSPPVKIQIIGRKVYLG